MVRAPILRGSRAAPVLHRLDLIHRKPAPETSATVATRAGKQAVPPSLSLSSTGKAVAFGDLLAHLGIHGPHKTGHRRASIQVCVAIPPAARANGAMTSNTKP